MSKKMKTQQKIRKEKLDRLYKIADLKLSTDYSNEQIGKIVHLSRERVRILWKEYGPYFIRAEAKDLDPQEREKRMQERDRYIETHLYAERKQKEQTAVSPEIKERLLKELETARQRNEDLGEGHKQHTNVKLIYRTLEREGYKLPSYNTIKLFIKRLVEEEEVQVYVDQCYEAGERIEIDLGYTRIYINGERKLVPYIVIVSVYSGYCYVDLLEDETAETVISKLVEFLHEIGGIPEEVVVDNGPQIIVNHYAKTEAEMLSTEARQCKFYYGLHFVACDIGKGNQKGTIENFVRIVRTEAFVNQYKFNTFEEARRHVKAYVKERNEVSDLEKDVAAMKPVRAERFEFFHGQGDRKVTNKQYVHYESGHYSAPRELAGKNVEIETSSHLLRILYDQEVKAVHELITEEEKEQGKNYRLQYPHFVSIFKEMPGSVKRSRLLRTNPDLNNIFTVNFNGKPRAFTQFLEEMAGLSKTVDQLRWCVQSFLDSHPNILEEEKEEESLPQLPEKIRKNSRIQNPSEEALEIEQNTAQSLNQLNDLVMGGQNGR